MIYFVVVNVGTINPMGGVTVFEILLDVIRQAGRHGDVQLVSIFVRVGALAVTNLGAARNGNGTTTVRLEGDDARNRLLADPIQRGASAGVPVRTATTGVDGGNPARLQDRYSLGMGVLSAVPTGPAIIRYAASTVGSSGAQARNELSAATRSCLAHAMPVDTFFVSRRRRHTTLNVPGSWAQTLRSFAVARTVVDARSSSPIDGATRGGNDVNKVISINRDIVGARLWLRVLPGVRRCELGPQRIGGEYH